MIKPIHLDKGVFRHADGSEVGLFGVNYYPCFFFSHDRLKKRGIDPLSVMEQDLQDFVATGINVVRIHVCEADISDGRGNVKPNEQLDCLDHLIARCAELGIYFFLTPVCWWGSSRCSKEAMFFIEEQLQFQERFYEQFMRRVNPCTGRAYAAEPGICVVELMNEPLFIRRDETLSGQVYPPKESLNRMIRRPEELAVWQGMYREFLAAAGMEESAQAYWDFRAQVVQRYIDRMAAALRRAGTSQAIAFNCWTGKTVDEAESDISDILTGFKRSKATALSFPAVYLGWRKRKPFTCSVDDLRDFEFTEDYDGIQDRGKVAYEFDSAFDPIHGAGYAAMAAFFRRHGCQIAAQFQYTPLVNAPLGGDWTPHTLNFRAQPAKAVAFVAGVEIFRRMPRYAPFDIIGGKRTDFAECFRIDVERDLVLMAAADHLIHSQSISEADLPEGYFQRFQDLRRVTGRGYSPVVNFGGNGWYDLCRLDDSRWRLRIWPSVKLLEYPRLEILDEPVRLSLSLPGASEYAIAGKTVKSGEVLELPPGLHDLRAIDQPAGSR